MTRPGDVVRALGAVLALTALVVGVPVGLALAVGWPLPTTLPSGDDLARALSQPVDAISDEIILKALALVVWVAWAQLVACVLVELAAAVKARRAGRVPLAGPLQTLASRLVGPLVVVLSLSGARPPAAEAVPLPTVLAHATSTTRVEAPPSAQASPPAAPSPAPAPAVTKTYLVRPGDTLWDIAEAHLRDEAGRPAPSASRRSSSSTRAFDSRTGAGCASLASSARGGCCACLLTPLGSRAFQRRHRRSFPERPRRRRLRTLGPL